MEACLNEELPPTTELEEGLRNGVYLAKLGNFFAPNVVSLKKIYDREQARYKVTGSPKRGLAAISLTYLAIWAASASSEQEVTCFSFSSL